MNVPLIPIGYYSTNEHPLDLPIAEREWDRHGSGGRHQYVNIGHTGSRHLTTYNVYAVKPRCLGGLLCVQLTQATLRDDGTLGHSTVTVPYNILHTWVRSLHCFMYFTTGRQAKDGSYGGMGVRCNESERTGRFTVTDELGGSIDLGPVSNGGTFSGVASILAWMERTTARQRCPHVTQSIFEASCPRNEQGGMSCHYGEENLIFLATKREIFPCNNYIHSTRWTTDLRLLGMIRAQQHGAPSRHPK